jgi:hypothetical protein
VSGLSKHIEFSELYSGGVSLEEEDNISIEGAFLKLHENQYLALKNFNIGTTKYTSNNFYYEIFPIDNDSPQKVRVFVADLEMFGENPPNKNLINRNRFDAYVYSQNNISESVVGKIRATLGADQKLIFVAEHAQTRFKSNQKIAKISSSIFGLLSFIFSILVFRGVKINTNLLER